MSKARPITEAEFKRTLAVARGTRHPERNILCLMLSARAGMRVGEIGGLDLADAYDEHAGAVRDRIYLAAERTK
jgi:integrase